VKLLSNDYTNPNTNPRTFTTLTLTLTDPYSAFESFCDFKRNYYMSELGHKIDTSFSFIIEPKDSFDHGMSVKKIHARSSQPQAIICAGQLRLKQ